MHEHAPLQKTATVERRRAAASIVHLSSAGAASPTATSTLSSAARTVPASAAVTVSAPVSIQCARVSRPSDPAELEATRTAHKVTHMGVPSQPPRVTNEEETKKKQVVQRAERASGGSILPTVPIAPSAGAPLPTGVRRYMEPRFGADFGNVRIHTGEAAATQSASLNAHAFTVGGHVFFGRNQYQPESATGRELIAHELTHTIQQGAAVQRSADVTVAERTGLEAQRLGIGEVLDWFADKANYVPGFRLLTIVLGMNPINMAPVERSAANILRGLLELIPITGALIAQALESYGIFAKVGAWIEGHVRTLGLVGSALKGALTKFLDSLSWRDIFSPGDVWERAKRIFTEPIDRLIAFGKSLASQILGFIREAILLPLARLAEGTRGYDLLKAVIGQDPVTGQPVPRTPQTLIGGFLKLIGQEEIWQNMQKANAIPRAWAWFQGALQGLMGFVSQIPGLFIAALKSLEITDLIFPPKAFVKLVGVFGNFVGQFISWGLGAAWKLLEIIFDVVSPGALKYIRKTGAALQSIFKNPLPFMGNLVKAAKRGFMNFADNFLTHLKSGLIDWLTGSLPGIYIPKAFALVEIAKFAFSVLGLTWENIRSKLVKVLGEPAVKILETTFDIVVTLVRDGPAAAWDKIKEQLANLKDMVIGGITDFIVDMVVKKAIPKLIAMFIPGAGFISAILSIYDTIMVFVNKISKIIQVVTGFIDSIVAIASGAIDAAAQRVEKILANLLSLAINFLAGFAGLGKVADKIMGVIQKIRQPIDKAIDWLIGWIVKAAKSLYAKGKAVAEGIVDWWKEKLGFTNKDGETHTLQFIGTGDTAKLGIATKLTPVKDYLDNHPDKGTPDWVTANSVFTAAMKVIYTPARKDADEKERRKQIKQELAKVSAAFARLSGEPPTADQYEKNTQPSYGNPAKVEYIVGTPLVGTKTGAWPVSKPGYKEIYDAGLTTATDKWVQMHIISEKLGGSGTNFDNLVPAPGSVNTGPFRTFEHAVAALARAKSGRIKNQVWVEVRISGTKTAATAISGKAGLYFWKGKGKWLKNETPSLTASAGIPAPQLKKGARRLTLNFTSGTEMTDDFKIKSATAALVKEGRPYASQAAFVASMTKRGATPAQIGEVLGKGAVLDGP